MTLPPAVEPDGKKHSIVLDRARDRLVKWNQNMLLAIVGPTGSGKSFSALRICQYLDPGFDASRIVFDAKGLLDLVIAGNLKAGSCILWDEGGVNLNSRDWNSQGNKAIFAVLMTFRNQNLGLVMTVPSFTFLDSGVRKLFHYAFETVYIDRIKEQVVLKPFRLEYGMRSDKVYTKYPIIYRNESFYRVDKLRVPKPSPHLVAEYEKMKNAFTKDLNLRMRERIMNGGKEPPKEKGPRQRGDYLEIAKKIAENPSKFISRYGRRGVLSPRQVTAVFGVGPTVADRAVGLARELIDEQKLKGEAKTTPE